jgi:hypothetical protein
MGAALENFETKLFNFFCELNVVGMVCYWNNSCCKNK